MPDDNHVKPDAEPASVAPVRVQRGVMPQPGEYWEHSYHGAVKVIRRWNDHECVCDILEYADRDITIRRRLLCDELMKGRLGHNTELSGGCKPSASTNC